MKIKAYQVAPECQESPLWLFEEVPEGLEIYGNKDYKRHTSAKFTVNEGGEHGAAIPAAFFRHYCAACEAVEMARSKEE